MPDLNEILEKARGIHGGICAGVVIGARMGIAGMRELGFDDGKKHRPVVFTEVDRCMTDGIQAATGCSIGHRSLMLVDNGKFAATFVDAEKNRAIRISASEKCMTHESWMERIVKDSKPGSPGIDMDDINKKLSLMPESDLLDFKEVAVDMSRIGLPGFPGSLKKCSVCDEYVIDGKEQYSYGKPVCKSCMGETYYREKID